MKLYLSKMNDFFINKKNKKYIYVILITGIVLLCIPSFTEGGEKETEKNAELSLYENSREMEKILSEISGVGKCEVMITYKCSNEYILARDKNQSENSNEEKNVIIGSGSGEKPFVIREEMPKTLGVVVVCEGGGDTVVKKNVSDAVCALCGISPNKVKVFKK